MLYYILYYTILHSIMFFARLFKPESKPSELTKVLHEGAEAAVGLKGCDCGRVKLGFGVRVSVA